MTFVLIYHAAVLHGVGEGSLCIENAWPGMARTIYGDEQRFLETYFQVGQRMREKREVMLK
jgi:acyl-coenzyme A synthetase/AMP-(fatty) acid ligase